MDPLLAIMELVGVFAYGGMLPVVCLLVSRLFRDDTTFRQPQHAVS